MTKTSAGAVPSEGPPQVRAERQTIAVLDYGGQYVQLIARRVRESRVYCEIFPHDVTAAELEDRGVIGVILSGGPASVYEEDAPLVDPAILDGRFPVLGICYGMHLMAHLLPGGVVVAEALAHFLVARCESHHQGWRVVRQVVVEVVVVAVGVDVADLRPIGGGTAKCKVPKVVRACVEVDIAGKPVKAPVGASS